MKLYLFVFKLDIAPGSLLFSGNMRACMVQVCPFRFAALTEQVRVKFMQGTIWEPEAEKYKCYSAELNPASLLEWWWGINGSVIKLLQKC